MAHIIWMGLMRLSQVIDRIKVYILDLGLTTGVEDKSSKKARFQSCPVGGGHAGFWLPAAGGLTTYR